MLNSFCRPGVGIITGVALLGMGVNMATADISHAQTASDEPILIAQEGSSGMFRVDPNDPFARVRLIDRMMELAAELELRAAELAEMSDDPEVDAMAMEIIEAISGAEDSMMSSRQSIFDQLRENMGLVRQ